MPAYFILGIYYSCYKFLTRNIKLNEINLKRFWQFGKFYDLNEYNLEIFIITTKIIKKKDNGMMLLLMISCQLMKIMSSFFVTMKEKLMNFGGL